MDQLDELAKAIFSKTPTRGLAVASGTSQKISKMRFMGSRLREGSSPVTERTFFDLQSITKVLSTGEVVAALIAQNEIKLETKLKDLLPEAVDRREKEAITIRHLLTHTAGYSDSSLDEVPVKGEELRKAMFNAKLNCHPGQNSEYADVGYRLLGWALERRTSKKLDELARNLVWKPLGLEGDLKYAPALTDFDEAAGKDTKSSREVDDEQVRALGEIVGSDGMFGTLKGLSIFCQHTLRQIRSNYQYRLSTGNNVSKKFTNFYDSLFEGKKIWAWEVPTSADAAYCGKKWQPGVLEKSGGAGTFICILPESDQFCVVLTNHGKPEPFESKPWNDMLVGLQVQRLSEVLLS